MKIEIDISDDLAREIREYLGPKHYTERLSEQVTYVLYNWVAREKQWRETQEDRFKVMRETLDLSQEEFLERYRLSPEECPLCFPKKNALCKLHWMTESKKDSISLSEWTCEFCGKKFVTDFGGNPYSMCCKRQLQRMKKHNFSFDNCAEIIP